MKRNVIVCGYPKSGNTWLTRLTAELIGCPVAGFWCEPLNQEIAIEGSERKSEYQCFKSHYTIEQLRYSLRLYGNEREKVIYIVRDPRDIIVSAAHFFGLAPRYRRLRSIMSHLPWGRYTYNRIFHSLDYKKDVLTEILLHGKAGAGYLETPWQAHVEGYLSSEALLIRYEDLIQDPLPQLEKVCIHVGVESDHTTLKTAVHNQSFQKRKKEFFEEGNTRKANFLRSGKTGEWKDSLDKECLDRIAQEIGPFMSKIGYT